MKTVFKKILLSAMFVLLGTSFAFSQDIVDVELVSLPSTLPLSGKNCDLTGMKVDIYYSNGNVTRQAYSVGNEDWTYTPDIKGNENVPENTTFVVSYKKFALPSFNSDWSADHAIPGVTKNTAHFYSNGVEFSSSEARENYKIIFPNSDPSVSGLTFCGWSATEIPSVQSEAPALVDKSNQVMGAADVNYYAVYSITNGYTDTYQFTINKGNYQGPISVKMVDGTDFNISLSNSNINIEGDKLVLGQDGGFLNIGAQSGSITNTTDLGKVTGIEIADNSNISTSGVGTGKFTVSTNNKKGTASSITVTFQKNREETFYVSTQPKINFVATDANDIEEGSPSYYATFSCPENVVISSANVEAYYVTVDKDGKLSLNEAGEKIDGKLHLLANTGYLLKINQGGQIDYNFEKIAYGSSSEPNMLVPCPATAVFKPEADGNYYYKLAYGNNTEKSNLGFWWGKDDGSGNFKVKVGGALLCVDPQSQAASLMRGLAFEQISGNETGLEEEMIIEDCSPAIYNLSGQRVNSVNKSGLYIVNGKTRWVNVK